MRKIIIAAVLAGFAGSAMAQEPTVKQTWTMIILVWTGHTIQIDGFESGGDCVDVKRRWLRKLRKDSKSTVIFELCEQGPKITVPAPAVDSALGN